MTKRELRRLLAEAEAQRDETIVVCAKALDERDHWARVAANAEASLRYLLRDLDTMRRECETPVLLYNLN